MTISNELLVSIIIVNYNGVKHLEECLDSIFNLTYKNIEIILIDNASKDNSINFVKKKYPRVKIIKLKKNYGFSQGNNIGVSVAKGKYFAFLNNDTSVDKDWLKELVNVIQSSNDIGICASKIYYYHDKQLINYAGGCLTKYGKAYHLGENQKDKPHFYKINETFYACGAAFLIKKKLYKKIGLFDPYYFAYAEDLDLSWRSWIFGYRVVYVPKSIIYHKIGQVMSSNLKKLKFYGEKNLLRTLLKNFELYSLFKILPVYIGRRIYMIFKNLIHFNQLAFLFSYNYIKAFLWNIINIKSLLKYRKTIQRNRINDDNFIFNLIKKINIS